MISKQWLVASVSGLTTDRTPTIWARPQPPVKACGTHISGGVGVGVGGGGGSWTAVS